jgi:DNA modification methylase
LTGLKISKFVIKDNVSGGEWDYDMLANQYELEELDAWGLELPGLTELGAEIEEDEPPAVSDEPPVSKPGEIYQLGRHRVMCGDSVSFDDVGKLFDGKQADMVFTDPPWNVNYGAVKAGNAMGYRADRTIENDNMGEDFTPWLNKVFGTMSAFGKDGCMVYVVMSAQEWGGLMNSLRDNGFHWSSTIIWNKDHLVLSRKDYHTKYEPIWYGWKEGESRLHPLQDRKQSDVWDIDRPTRSEEHPTMKPIELCARAIQNSSSKRDIVLDLFLGSGSTLIACEQTDRICYGMELDEKYLDVIRKRWAKYVYPDRWEKEWEILTPAIQ